MATAARIPNTAPPQGGSNVDRVSHLLTVHLAARKPRLDCDGAAKARLERVIGQSLPERPLMASARSCST